MGRHIPDARNPQSKKPKEKTENFVSIDGSISIYSPCNRKVNPLSPEFCVNIRQWPDPLVQGVWRGARGWMKVVYESL